MPLIPSREANVYVVNGPSLSTGRIRDISPFWHSNPSHSYFAAGYTVPFVPPDADTQAAGSSEVDMGYLHKQFAHSTATRW